MKSFKAILWVVSAAVSYGLLTPLIKIGYIHGWMANQITASQLLIGTILLWLCVIWKKEVRKRSSFDKKAFMIGFSGLGFSTVCYNQSLIWQEGSVAIIWMFQYVWMTVVIEAFKRKQWPKLSNCFGILVILVGTWFASGASNINGGFIHWQGVLLGLLSALGYAIFIVGSSSVSQDVNPYRNGAMMMTGTIPWGILLIIQNIFSQNDLTIQASDWTGAIFFGAILGLIGQVIPTLGYQLGGPILGSSRSAIIGSLELPVAVISSVLLLAEGASLVQWFGVVLIFIGVIWTQMGSFYES